VNFLVAGGKLMSTCTEEVPRGRQRGVSWWRRTEGVKKQLVKGGGNWDVKIQQHLSYE